MSEEEFTQWKKVRQDGAVSFILIKGLQFTLAFSVGTFLMAFLFFNGDGHSDSECGWV